MDVVRRLSVAASALIITVVFALAAQAAAPAAVVPLREAIARLPVVTESREGYAREKVKHWVDADRDGCSTRAEVLLEEAVLAPTTGARCTLTGGSWYSAYDDVYVADASRLDIDHMVPLAEAWDSGARRGPRSAARFTRTTWTSRAR